MDSFWDVWNASMDGIYDFFVFIFSKNTLIVLIVLAVPVGLFFLNLYLKHRAALKKVPKSKEEIATGVRSDTYGGSGLAKLAKKKNTDSDNKP